METDIRLTIGGEEIAVPPMCFAALKRAWPAIQALPNEPHLVGQVARVVEIVAAALQHSRPDLTVPAIEARLQGRELLGIVGQLPSLLEASGLIAAAGAPGEPPAGS